MVTVTTTTMMKVLLLGFLKRIGKPAKSHSWSFHCCSSQKSQKIPWKWKRYQFWSLGWSQNVRVKIPVATMFLWVELVASSNHPEMLGQVTKGLKREVLLLVQRQLSIKVFLQQKGSNRSVSFLLYKWANNSNVERGFPPSNLDWKSLLSRKPTPRHAMDDENSTLTFFGLEW